MTYAPNENDRLMVAIRDVIRTEIADVLYSSLWEYSVSDVKDDDTISGLPTANIPLPDLNDISVAALMSGGVCRATKGTTFLVEFFNQSGAIYAAVFASPTVETATLDATRRVDVGPNANIINLGPDPSKIVARTGDSVVAFCTSASFTGQHHPTTGPVPPPWVNYPCTVICPAPSIITSGAGKVYA